MCVIIQKYFVMQEDLEKHRETIDRENPRDFLDMYLIEMENQTGNPNSSFCGKLIKNSCI
jgi:hypothetical protein